MLKKFTKENVKKVAKYYVVLLLVAFFIALFTNFVFAQGVETPPPPGFDNTLGLENIEEDVMLQTDTDIRLLIVNLINVFLGLVGIILLGLVMYAGWLYMSSEGDVDKINTSKNILKNAAIGLLIILSAFAIVNFILRALLFGDGGVTGSPRDKVEDWRGVSALGDGILESHYPTRDQHDVPINTMIFVTFKEEIDASTICKVDSSLGTDNTKCDGDTLISDNVRIYLSDESGSDANDTDALRRSDDRVLVSSTDNKTFIFRPLDFLGSQGAPAWFAVKLMGGGKIMKADGDKVDFDLGADDWYKWKFETNGELDLIPPKVASIFPWPDSDKDTRNALVQAKPSTGRIEVNSRPNVYKASTKSAPIVGGNSLGAIVNGDYTCGWTGTITVAINGTSADISGNGDGIIERDIDLTDGINLGCGLILQSGDRSYTEGNSWTINVTPEIKADTLTIGDRVYTFGDGKNGTILASDNNSTAEDIMEKTRDNPVVSTSYSDNIVTLVAKIAGSAGDDIKLLTSNDDALKITTMHGGADMTEDIIVNGLEDQPRNAVVQINFNEAVNPIYVSGDAGDVSAYIKVQNVSGPQTNGGTCSLNQDCLSYKCDEPTKICVGDYIDGKFLISNVYKTVEFITNHQCGMNSCGENVFCLPPLSNIKVSLKAASLFNCAGDSDNCLPTVGIIGDYPVCSSSTAGEAGICQNLTGQNYPQASLTEDGITDAANNSLDGDKNGDAEGSFSQSGTNAFNENELLGICISSAREASGRVCSYSNAEKVCGDASHCTGSKLSDIQDNRGDDYTWSFFTSDAVDLVGPVIKEAKGSKVNTTSEKLLVDVEGTTGKQVLGIDTAQPITFLFDKLMMSSTLKPGRNYGAEDIYPGTDPAIQKEYFVFANFSGRPLGDWVTKEDMDNTPDGYPDETKAIINHTEFRDNSSYGKVVGSGARDIYQNCYNPAADEGLGDSQCGGTTSGQSCCKGVINTTLTDMCREF